MRTYIVITAPLVLAVFTGCSSAEKKPDAPVTHEEVAEPAAPSPDAFLVAPEAGPVYFGFDEHLLSEGARKNLSEIATYMEQKPEVRVTIDGHCDELGTSEYNLALGDKRAHAARAYLSALGVPKDRVSVVSWGEERPVVSGTDAEARSLNRRDEFTLYVLGETTASAEDFTALDVVMAWRDWDDE
jgi:peptidoglycan-associated lipoprotein